MYQPDRKQWFLDESNYEEPVKQLLIRIFDSTELEEKTFGKDVSEFNEEEAIDLLKSYDSKSRRRLKNTAHYLSKYREWWKNKNNNVSMIDPFDNRTIDTIVESIIPEESFNNMFFTKNDIMEYMDDILDDMNKFIIVAIFYSIKGEDLVNLKMEDLNQEDMTVSLQSGRVMKVDDFFVEYMKRASVVEIYKTGKDQSELRNLKMITYVNNGYVIRCCAGGGDLYDYKPSSLSFINQRLIKIKEQIGNEFINISNLYKNGIINYIKEQYEKQGISLKTALTQMINNKRYMYEQETQKYIHEFGSKMEVKILRMQIKDYLDYYM